MVVAVKVPVRVVGEASERDPVVERTTGIAVAVGGVDPLGDLL
jgi:hypothetical protein